eukprot:5093077-Pleurochrysis_carterae.AAC.1
MELSALYWHEIVAQNRRVAGTVASRAPAPLRACMQASAGARVCARSRRFVYLYASLHVCVHANAWHTRAPKHALLCISQ